jgi:hypothetical protein
MNKQPEITTYIKNNVSLSHIVFDSQFEAILDSITLLTSNQLNAPVCLITFVDDESIWIQSEVGSSNLPKVIPNKQKFCGIFPQDRQFYEIVDTDLDPHHKEHLFAVDGIKARYYAAARIKLPLGEMIGVLCVFDIEPRQLTSKQRDLMIDLADVIEKIFITKNIKKLIR